LQKLISSSMLALLAVEAKLQAINECWLHHTSLHFPYFERSMSSSMIQVFPRETAELNQDKSSEVDVRDNAATNLKTAEDH
jgi:hypothetical protein